MKKKCKKCGEIKPLTKEFYFIHNKYKNKFRPTCKECLNRRSREIRKERKMYPGKKKCNVCNRWFPKEVYVKGIKKCPECRRIENRNYYLKNKDRLLASAKRWQSRQPKTYSSDLYKKRFFQTRARSIIDRLKSKGAKPDYKTREFKKYLASLWRKQKGLCVLSGMKLTRENAEVDHITPTSKHMDCSYENIRWVVKTANRAKFDKTDGEFYEFIEATYNYAKEKKIL